MPKPINFISFGTVMSDPVPNSPYVKVLPSTSLMLEDGDLAEKTTVKQTMTDEYGNEYNYTEEKVNWVDAKWLAFNQPNRLTPPMMYKGMKVMLLKLYDADEYYFITLYNEYDKSQLEEVTLLLSNKSDLENPGDDDILACTYQFTASTLNKQIQLKTAKNDNEPTIFNLLMDTKQGVMYLSDDLENIIFLNSVAGKLLTYLQTNYNQFVGADINYNVTANVNKLVNQNTNDIIKGSKIEKVTGAVTVMSEADLLEYIEGSFQLLSKTKLTAISKGEVFIEGKKGATLSGSTGKIYIFSGNAVDITAPMINLNSPSINATGVIMCGGLSMGGAKPGNVTPPSEVIQKPDLSSLDELEKTIIEETKYPLEKKDGEDDEEQEEEKKEDKKEEEEDEKPDSPSTDPSSTDCNLKTDGNVTIKASKVSIKAQTGSLGDVLDQLDELATALSDIATCLQELSTAATTITTPTGPGAMVIPTITAKAPTLTTSAVTIKNKIATLKQSLS